MPWEKIWKTWKWTFSTVNPKESIVSQKKISIKNIYIYIFSEVVGNLRSEKLQDIWTLIHKKDEVIIILLDTTIAPVVKASVVINKKLDLQIYIEQVKIGKLEKSTRRIP